MRFSTLGTVFITWWCLTTPIENALIEQEFNVVPTERVPALKRPPPKRFQNINLLDYKCQTVDLVSDLKLKDEKFTRTQLACILEEGPCDELGTTLKSKNFKHFKLLIQKIIP